MQIVNLKTVISLNKCCRFLINVSLLCISECVINTNLANIHSSIRSLVLVILNMTIALLTDIYLLPKGRYAFQHIFHIAICKKTYHSCSLWLTPLFQIRQLVHLLIQVSCTTVDEVDRSQSYLLEKSDPDCLSSKLKGDQLLAESPCWLDPGFYIYALEFLDLNWLTFHFLMFSNYFESTIWYLNNTIDLYLLSQKNRTKENIQIN